jgi:hypothetical protein
MALSISITTRMDSETVDASLGHVIGEHLATDLREVGRAQCGSGELLGEVI